MAAWTLVPSLVSLRDEFNQLAPGRDKASDGSVGDQSHAAGESDHNPDETGNTPTEDADSKNEVHAIDVDHNLRKPGWDMDRCVDIIIDRHRRGEDDRLQNVIYNRRIWSRSWGWTPRAYTGPNAHTEHAHFSGRYTTAQESDTRPWGLLEDDMPTAEQIAEAVWSHRLQDPYDPDNPNRNLTAGTWMKYVPSRGQVAALAGKDFVDEAAIVAGVLAGLPAGAIDVDQLVDQLVAVLPGPVAEQTAQKLAARLAA